MPKKIAAVLLFVALVVGIFYGVGLLENANYPIAPPRDGVVDLRGYDFAADIVNVKGVYDFYPNQLYTPEDFALGGTIPAIPEINDYTLYQYGTYRTVLLLPPGTVLAASGKSAQYAQTLYLGGQLAGAVGTVGTTRETTVPRTETYTYAFTVPESGEVEVIFQYSNFNHREGGGTRPMYVGSVPNIQSMNITRTVNVSLITGCLLTVFLFYFGVWLIHRRRGYYLFFALCCLFVGLRGLFMGDKVIMVFFPTLNWYLAMAMEYLFTNAIAVCFVAYLAGLLPKLLHKYAVLAFYAFSAMYAVLVVFCEPRVYSQFLAAYQIGVAVFALYVLVRLAAGLRVRRLEEGMLFAGAAVFILGSLLDMVGFRYVMPTNAMADFSQVATMACIYLNMVALALEQSRTEHALNLSRMKERELLSMNAQIERQLKRLHAGAAPPRFERGPLALDAVAGQAYLNGQSLALTPKEFAVLLLLAQREGEALTKEEIYEAVWKQPMGADTNAVKTVASRLRGKLLGSGYGIAGGRGGGYAFGPAQGEAEQAAPATPGGEGERDK